MAKKSEHEIKKKEMCIEFWVILYIWNDMIEKLCPGLALCSISNQLLLLYSSKIIFPIRAAFFCLFTNMEAWSLVSTSQVLCTADSAFYCMLNYDSHILGRRTLIVTWHWRPRLCSPCQFSPPALSGLVSSPHICPHCEYGQKLTQWTCTHCIENKYW